MRNSGFLATDTETNPGTEAESRQQEWNAWKLYGEKVRCRTNITLLSRASVMLPGTQACSAKIETQHRQAQRIQ